MKTFYIFKSDFTDDMFQIIEDTLTRMGWCYDEEWDAWLVNVPIEDLKHFVFIFEGVFEPVS